MKKKKWGGHYNFNEEADTSWKVWHWKEERTGITEINLIRLLVMLLVETEVFQTQETHSKFNLKSCWKFVFLYLSSGLSVFFYYIALHAQRTLTIVTIRYHNANCLQHVCNTNISGRIYMMYIFCLFLVLLSVSNLSSLRVSWTYNLDCWIFLLAYLLKEFKSICVVFWQSVTT